MPDHRPRRPPVIERIGVWVDAQQSRPAAPTLWWVAALALGMATLGHALILQGVFPANGAAMAAGYGSPIIAFEFARSQADLTAIFGNVGDPDQAARLIAMQSGNEQDYLFMLLYALFLTSGLWALWREVRRPLLLLGVVMPLLAALFDAWENWLMFEIQAAFAVGEYTPAIDTLAVPVAAKFLLLTATNVLIGYGVMHVPGRGWQLAGVLVIVPCVASIMALVAPAAFGWTLSPVLAAGWTALLGTAVIASWRALVGKRPLARFDNDGLGTVPQRSRSTDPSAAADDARDAAVRDAAVRDAATPVRPATFGRRRNDAAPGED